MNGLRKFFTLFVVLAVAGFALPAMAGPSKLYKVDMCVGTFAPGISGACTITQEQLLNDTTKPTTLQARIANWSPPNINSNFNSADLFVGVNWRAVNGSVTVLNNSGNYNIDTTVPRHVKVSNLSPVKPNGYVTLQFDVDNASCGDGTWDAKVYGGSGFTGAVFDPAPGYVPNNTTVACLNLACTGVAYTVTPQGNVLGNDPTSIQLTRGLYDTDGTTTGTTADSCTKRFVYVTPTVTSPTKLDVHTTWDQGTADAQAAFSYTINARSATTGSTPPTIALAWLLTTTTPPVPDYQPALACDLNQNYLPKPLATVVADNGNKIDVALVVLASALPPVPFAVVIEDERLLVTKVNLQTNTFTVDRHTGGTFQVTHVANLPIMSTPFKIVQSTDNFAASYVGKPVKVCLSGWAQTFNPGATNEWKATIIDGSDAWVRVGQ